MDLRKYETGVAAAENGSTTDEVLSKLARHEHTDVRIAVADNPHASAEILALLAMDESVDVRYSLAENHNIPVSVLSILCSDENPYVAYRANKTLKRLRHSSFGSILQLQGLKQRQKCTS